MLVVCYLPYKDTVKFSCYYFPSYLIVSASFFDQLQGLLLIPSSCLPCSVASAPTVGLQTIFWQMGILFLGSQAFTIQFLTLCHSAPLRITPSQLGV